MLIVKPVGALTVTYELRDSSSLSTLGAVDEKTCPQCAERVKAAALVCRFCGHKFTTASVPLLTTPYIPPAENTKAASPFKPVSSKDSNRHDAKKIK